MCQESKTTQYGGFIEGGIDKEVIRLSIVFGFNGLIRSTTPNPDF